MALPTYSECRSLIDNGGLTKPDADISGLGVITAFIFSAYVTFIATLVAYAFGLVDDGLLRPVDRLVFRVPSRASRHPQVHVALRKAILALSDQQIVTGIAILGAGFQGLREGSMNVYHFQTVIYLAWMSSSVHLSALTILRPYLHNHRGVMAWRLVGMMVLLVLLLIALVPTVSNDWAVVSTNPNLEDPIAAYQPNSGFGVPAICFWGSTWGHGVNPDSIMSFAVLFISYCWKMGGMFLSFRTRFERLRNPVDHLMKLLLVTAAKRYDRSGGRFWVWIFRLFLALYIPLTALLESLASFSAALWLSALGLIYGTLQILVPRLIMEDLDPSVAAQESQFGFGQLVPIILLVQPLGAVLEHFWLKDKKTEDEGMYKDHGDANTFSSSLGSFQDSGHPVELPDKPLLQFMATYTTTSWQRPAPKGLQLRAFLYSSKLFQFSVFLVHAATAATAAVIFWADYHFIGVTSTPNWDVIIFGVAGWVAAAPLSVLVLAPFSRLGCCRYGERNDSSLVERVRRSFVHDVPLDTLSEAPLKSESKPQSPFTTETGHASAEEWSRFPNARIDTEATLVEGRSTVGQPHTSGLDDREEQMWAKEWRRRSVNS